MVTRARTITFVGIFLAGAALPGHAQQKVHGDMPDGAFAIDRSKVASWSDKTFSTTATEFAGKKVEAQNLDLWTHEFPTRYSSMSEKSVDVESVDLAKWTGGEAGKWEGEKQKAVEIKEADLSAKSAYSSSLVVNEKWARSARKDEVEKKAEERTHDFIVQAKIRPLGVPEVQEKLNEYSSPPGERQKRIPVQLQK